jgi:L-rhamnose mutarotase
MSTNKHCFITTLKPGKLSSYSNLHDKIYPEVVTGLRAAGVISLNIHHINQGGGDTLVMYIVTEEGVDLGSAIGPG